MDATKLALVALVLDGDGGDFGVSASEALAQQNIFGDDGSDGGGIFRVVFRGQKSPRAEEARLNFVGTERHTLALQSGGKSTRGPLRDGEDAPLSLHPLDDAQRDA